MRVLPARRAAAAPRPGRGESGVAAVELALVAPVLVALVAGICDFGYRYQQHIQYTNAAMQTARSMSISNNQGTATTEARSFVSNPATQVSFSTGGCNPGTATVKVTLAASRPTLTGMFGKTFTVRASGQVRCE